MPPRAVTLDSVAKRADTLALGTDLLSEKFDSSESFVNAVCTSAERNYEDAARLRRDRRDLRGEFTALAADVHLLQEDVRTLLRAQPAAAGPAVPPPPPAVLPARRPRGRSRTREPNRQVYMARAAGKGPGSRPPARRTPPPTTPTSATSPASSAPPRAPRLVGMGTAGKEPLAPGNLTRGDWSRLRCQLSRLLAHGHAVDHAEIRGARATDRLDVQFSLWAFRGWVSVGELTRLLNVTPATLAQAIKELQGHYEVWPQRAGLGLDQWLRATKHADWRGDVRRAVAASADAFLRWRRLVRNGFDAIPERKPVQRLRRPPVSAADSEERPPAEDSGSE